MLTVFTPTFNRAHTLGRVYESLRKQSNYNLEWVIVDDGSTDETELLVNQFEEDLFTIRYFKIKNSGKHVATNVGIKAARGDLFTCLDSDDWFYPDAVDYFLNFFESNVDVECLITLDTFEDGTIVGEKLPDIHTVNWVDLRYIYKVRGDKCYVFRLSTIRNMTFPQYGKSKHMPPSYQLLELSIHYKCHLSNKKTKFVEYQNDGISSKVKTNYFVSAENYCVYRKLAYYLMPNRKEKVKEMLLYNISWLSLGLDCKYKFKSHKERLLSILLLPPSILLRSYYKIKLK
ncbi:glycosyltransferase family A protein [Staphylococcus simulans]|uniref:glycosyltransferase family 2 protein n=1 Tax=Staphylococcus simulans TaxID=1286 RepID=UPI0027F26AE8|nr:glycosyltransferase family A protein [Staphylococcus simulans]MDQ7111898.1 glycosyltransferase family A protein [Staphylococcus simulans]MDQ7117509.1 glycosyltransferase family A protein [Staphylococcus simulans]WMM09808.1 glycosyltransferase family A protein [Staphylococcus simulans]